jgi:hypothetical protein
MQIDGAVLHCNSLKANCCYAENPNNANQFQISEVKEENEK